MPFISALNKHPDSKIYLNEGSLSYKQILERVEKIPQTQSPLIFQPEWSFDSLCRIFAAARDNATLMLTPKGALAPDSIPEVLSKGFLLLRTSGSEGAPKWVAHDWSSLKPGLPIEKPITHLAASLMPSHAAALEVLFGAISQGVTLSLGDHWREKNSPMKPDAVAGPPQQLGIWLATKNRILENLKLFYSCADAMQPIWIKKKELVAPNLEIIQVYGCTEAWQAPTKTHPEKPWLVQLTDQSWSLKGNQIQITSSRLAKFWLYADGSMAPLVKPYLLGDEARNIEEGYFQIQSARHEVANFWGQKINLLEIESKLLEVEGIVDATAVSLQDPLAGQSLVLELVLAPSNSEDSMREKLKFLDALLPKGSWVPRFVGNATASKKRRHTRS
ncbi:MAG: hypothetical protein K2P81_16800 [Bacteriovoracaceae bacterium]|nr:hypothetical protein [Bacteriovoracaceae bacterium]